MNVVLTQQGTKKGLAIYPQVDKQHNKQWNRKKGSIVLNWVSAL